MIVIVTTSVATVAHHGGIASTSPATGTPIGSDVSSSTTLMNISTATAGTASTVSVAVTTTLFTWYHVMDRSSFSAKVHVW